MKRIYVLLVIVIIGLSAKGQTSQNYCDFEGIKLVVVAEYSGQLDSNATNTHTDAVNMSAKCAKYIRDTALYDNFKFFPFNKFSDVAPWTNSSPTAPKLNMKVWSSAAPGTKIELQLGTRTNSTYPGGVFSIHTASTTMQRAWETINFNYIENPSGGFTNSMAIDKIVVLFNPNSHARDTIMFDDPTGPATIPVGINEHSADNIAMFQIAPNPAYGTSSVNFTLNKPGHINLSLYDIQGRKVSTLLDENIAIGTHQVPVNFKDLDCGLYFCRIENEGGSSTVKLIALK